MNKAELVNAIASKAEITQTEANKILNALLETVTDTLKKEEPIVLVGFGTFEVKARAARVARNLRTGEPMTIPAKKVPGFRAGKGLKDAVNIAKKPAAKKVKK